MRKPHLLTIGFLLISLVITAASVGNAQTNREISDFAPLRNQDVLNMVDGKYPADAMLTIIRLSPCNFDTFPPVLQGLKRRGVPGPVLEAMVGAPYGPPANTKHNAAGNPIYHYTELLKQRGFVPGSDAPREGQSSGFSADRRKAGGILRREP